MKLIKRDIYGNLKPDWLYTLVSCVQIIFMVVCAYFWTGWWWVRKNLSRQGKEE